ncbi:MAG: hypothetical protein H7210_07080 [Pyrinomonadaceae bacterium]|nr:hypothetical protein [Phycisphaerales bacterium]
MSVTDGVSSSATATVLQPLSPTADTSTDNLRFLRYPTRNQQDYLAFVQWQLSRAPFESQLDVDTPALGSVAASLKIKDAAAVAADRFHVATELQIRQLDDLLSEYQQALAVYLEGTEPALRAYWDAKALLPLPDSSEYNTPYFWESSCRTLRQSRLSTELVVIRPRYLDGMAGPYHNSLDVSGIYNRPGRYPRADNPQERQLTVYEILVGVEAIGSNGQPFTGFLGLWMSYDHDAETPKWVLSRIEIHTNPARVGVIMPKL